MDSRIGTAVLNRGIRVMKTALTLARWLGLAFICGLYVTPAMAADDPVALALLAKLKAARADLEYAMPHKSAIQGLYEVSVKGGPTLFLSADGSLFVAGDLFSIGPGGFTNLAEKQRDEDRRQALAALKTSDMIVFAPENPKATVTVFTDIDCGYCRKFHQEVPALNAMGIAVQYLAFPRAGLDSPSFRKIATAWCSAGRAVRAG
jgi:thiol:disulfide interchange protein DsbC